MDLKEKYIYAVVSKLPKEQREEIAEEVRMLIDDMMGDNDEKRLEDVLLELGDPSKLADKYREHSRYLIGPKYYNNYIYTLKIVIFTVIVCTSISAFIGILDDNYINFLTNYISNTLSACIYAFTLVTVIFVLLEYKGVELGNKEWSLKDLPPVPHKKAIISRKGTIIGIIFTTAILVILYLELFGIFIPKENDGFVLIPIFNYENLYNFKIVIVVFFLLALLKEVLKLIYGKWNLQLAILISIITIINAFMFVIVLSNNDVWNLNLTSDIANTLNISQEKIKFSFDDIIDYVIIIGILGFIIDIIVTMYKGYKYNK